MSDHTNMKPPSPWLPERDRTSLLLLGKLAEEASELAGRCARSIIQGLDGLDPEDGRPNWKHLMEEIADVRGLSALVADYEGFDDLPIEERAQAKFKHKLAWVELVKDMPYPEEQGE
jgi:hypothetical protein